MKKKLIALAVAGLVSGAAFAQSNVTIYGVMDTTWENYKVSGSANPADDVKSHKRLASNSSYIGFKGAESLGNGLTAVFQFETGISADEGGWGNQAGTTEPAYRGTRDTMVALAGGFGTIAAGNLTGPVRAIGAAVDFNPGASSSGFPASMYGEFAGIKTGTDDRSQNAIAYISPTFGGLYGVLVYENGTPASDASTVDKKSHAWTGGLVYANGPLFAGIAYLKANNPTVGAAVTTAFLGADASGGNDDSLKNYRLSAKYTFSTGTTISGLYDSQKYTIDNVTDAKRATWMLGANQNFGASNVWLQFAKAKKVKGDLCDLIDCGETAGKQITLGYSYNLSKRTMLHAYYSKISNDDGAAYNFYVNSAGAKAGGDSKVYSFGMRHTF